VSASSEPDWLRALAACGDADSYHLPGYHRVEAARLGGRPWLFVYEDTYGVAALPFLLRDIPVEGLPLQARDATSVYGYPGLVTSVSLHSSESGAFRSSFTRSLSSALRDLGVVSLFVRQSPLNDTSWLLEGLGTAVRRGETVAVDLTLSEAEMLAQARKTHRASLRKAERSGLTFEEDVDLDGLDDFVRLYTETMDRNGAAPAYYFTREHYEGLKRELGSGLRCFHGVLDERIVASVLVLAAGSALHYHLGGSDAATLDIGPTRFVLDRVARWGRDHGYRRLHLGGGVNGREDSLFRFKAGFSRIRLAFCTVHVVADPEAYSTLTELRRRTRETSDSGPSAFFPAYRS
jgi:hypothetical protein